MSTTTTHITPFLENFLIESTHLNEPFLRKIFESGDEFGKKAMQISWLQAAFLQMLIKISDSRNILEVGTYVGFSASVLATASPHVKSVTTCEILPEHHRRATANIEEHGLTDRITMLLGDAKELLSDPSITEQTFDMFFLDGDKENYEHYLNVALSILPPGGLFIVDNTLFKGEIIGGISAYSVGIRSLLDSIHQHPAFDVSHITIGDGMLIARRKKL